MVKSLVLLILSLIQTTRSETLVKHDIIKIGYTLVPQSYKNRKR
jgi:hypothetical protein